VAWVERGERRPWRVPLLPPVDSCAPQTRPSHIRVPGLPTAHLLPTLPPLSDKHTHFGGSPRPALQKPPHSHLRTLSVGPSVALRPVSLPPPLLRLRMPPAPRSSPPRLLSPRALLSSPLL